MRPNSIAFICCCLTAAAQTAAPDAREIVQRSIEKNQQDDARLRDYTYNETTVQRMLDRAGKLVKTETKRFEVTNLYGSQYRHLVAKDGRPLEGSAKEKADAEYDREVHKRQVESDDDRRKREEKQTKQRAESRKYLEEIPNAYDLKIVGEETIEGLPVWVIQATPHPGYRPKVKEGELLTKVGGKLWIDKAGGEWVKIEGEVTQPITFGGFLAKVDQGAKLTFLSTRINNEIWVPAKVTVKLGARILFKHANIESDTTYTDYQRFRVESKLIAEEPAAAPKK